MEEVEEIDRIKVIRKRDGRIVVFDGKKIRNVIRKAAVACGIDDWEFSKRIANEVIEIAEMKCGGKVPTVEQIQDIVEEVLVREGQYKIAKAYILYRAEHARLRELKSTFVDAEDTIDAYLNQKDWRVNENSNEDFSLSGLFLYGAGKLISTYALTRMYGSEISEAHKKGYMHIHDLSHAVVGYCAGWSLKNLLLMGFGHVPNKATARPARHLDVVVHHMINFIGCLQMEFAGAMAFSSVDTLMAPFVKADNLDYKQTKQNVQKLVYSLNTPSRWGAQTPFSNLTFDWVVPASMQDEKAIVGGKEQNFTYGDCQSEADMINKAFIEVMLEGDAEEKVFTFPIPTYNITKDFDWNHENSDLLFEMTAKYGLPYFQNYVGSGLDPDSIKAMCCRLNLDMRQLINRPGHSFAAGDSTGSLGVVTLNVSRLGYESRDKQEFFEKIRQYMSVAKDSLEIKRRIVDRNLNVGLMQYAKAYLGHFRNHFSTIGLCGMNEACLNLLGVTIADPEGKKLTIETLTFMRDVLREFQVETGNLYNLEATPAESAAYRFALLDKKYHPDITTAGMSDKYGGGEPYLTNSTQLPVDYTDDLPFAINHQSDIQPLYTGGTVFHALLGERLPSTDSCKHLVRKMSQTKLPYYTITPTFSICDKHGYLAGNIPICPRCNTETNVYSRVVGYYRPVKNWNKGKKEEFKERKTFNTLNVANAVKVKDVGNRNGALTAA